MKEMNLKDNKILIIILSALLIIITLLSLYVRNKNSDALKFKEEYESLNDTIAYKDIKYPTVSLDKKNPFVYKKEDEIINIIENGTGLIYLGYPKCPWCRNAVNVLQKVSAKEIYYLNMYDLRDEYKIVNGVLTKNKNGSKGYYKLLKLLDSVLDDYEIEDNGVKYSTKEKRIYVPLVVGIKDGKIVGYHMDTVDLKDNQSPMDLLDKKQQEKLLEIYENINISVNSEICDIDDQGGC